MGGAYFYSINLNKKNDSLEKILTTFQIITAKDTFSDWQTVKNNDLEIEIKYPYNYRADSTTQLITVYPVPQPIEWGPSLVVSRKLVLADTNIDTYVDNLLQSVLVKEKMHTTINGINWIKVRYYTPDDAGPGRSNAGYFSIHKVYVYRVIHDTTYSIHIDNFEKIVSTIKFNF